MAKRHPTEWGKISINRSHTGTYMETSLYILVSLVRDGNLQATKKKYRHQPSHKTFYLQSVLQCVI